MFRRYLLAVALVCVSHCAFGQNGMTYAYDETGRVIGTVDAAGNAVRYSYDAVGNIIAITRLNGTTPTILSFQPTSGPAGTLVTITGSSFSATAAQDAVTLNGVAATVQSATTTTLTALVPAGATTGLIKVTSPAGSVTSTSNFTVTTMTGPPSITSFTPPIAVAGAAITVNGMNFYSTPANDRLGMGGAYLPAPTSATATALKTVAPTGVGSGHISIQTPVGGSTSTADLFIPPAPYTAAQVSFTTRTSLETPTPIALTTPSTIGMVLIDLVAGSRFSVEALQSDFPACGVQMYNPSNVGIWANQGPNCAANGFFDAVTVPVSGTYMALVNPGSYVGTTNLRFHQFSDVQVTTMPGGPAFNVATTVPGQNETVMFNATSPQHVLINLGVSTYSSCLLYVYAPDTTLLVNQANCASSQPTLLDLGTLNQTGAYKIVFDPQGKNTGQLSMNLINAPMVADGGLTSGTAASLTTTVPYQQASATFAGTTGQQISMLASGKYTDAGRALITIQNPDGSQLTTFTVNDGATAYLSPVTLTQTGAFTVISQPQSGATGTTKLTMYQVPAPASLTTTPGAGPVTIATNIPGQTGALSFTATAGEHVTWSILSATYPQCILQFVDTTGKAVRSFNCSSAPVNSADMGALAVAGTYKVLVYPDGADTGNVTMRIDTAPNVSDGSVAAGQTIKITTTAPDEIGTATFTGTVGERISLQGSGSYINAGSVIFSLTKPDGSYLEYFTLGDGAGYYFDTMTLTQAGTYTLTLYPYGTTYGTTVFRLNQIPNDVTGTLTVGGAAVTTTITTPGQNASLTYSATAGQHLILDMVASSFSACVLKVVSPSAVQLVSANCNSALPSQVDLGTISTSGVYTISIDPSGANVGTLKLALMPVGVAAGGSVLATTGSPATFLTTTAGQISSTSFIATAGQRVSLSGYGSYNTGYATVVVSLPDGTVLKSMQVNNGSLANTGLLTIPIAGTCTVLIEPYSTTTGTTQLSVATIPADLSIPATSGVAATATNVAQQQAAFTFAGTAGQTISMSVAGNYNGNTTANATLLAPDGSIVSTFYVYSGSTTYLDATPLQLTGTYRLAIQPQGAGGQTTLTYQTVPADVTAAATLNGAAVKLTTTTPGQNAELAFSATAGQHVFVQAPSSTYSSCNTQIYAPDGTYLNGFTCSSSSLQGIDLGVVTQTGTFTVFIDPQGANVGSVTLSALNIVDVSGGTATSGTPLTITTTESGQKATLSFTGTAGQSISLLASGIYHDYYGATLTITKPFGGTLTSLAIYSNSTSFLDATLLPVTGNYTITIQPSSGSFGASTVTLYTLSPTAPVTAKTDGTPVVITTSTPGQNASFLFPATAGQHMVWNATTSTYGSCSMRIYDPQGNYLNSLTCSSQAPVVLDLGILASTGNYQIVVDPQSSYTGSVTTNVVNASDLSLGALVSGTTINAAFTIPGQNAHASFTATAGERISMLLASQYENAGSATVTLEEPDGTVVKQVGSNDGTTTFLDPITLPVAGKYTIYIDPQGTATGTTALTVYQVPADLTVAATVNGAAVTVATPTPGQNATVTFTGTTGKQITITSSGTYSYTPTLAGYANVSIKNPSGTVLTNLGIHNQISTKTVLTLSVTGTYSIVIDPYLGSSGSAVISITSN
jgi:YD repeat-containing protein